MDDIVIDASGPIGVVRLNRPERGNSVTPDVVTRLGDAVEALTRADGIDAVVLTGTGKVFCAGADVNDMYAIFRASGADGLCDYLADVWMPAVQRTSRMIWRAEKPVVAAYNGAATAGGLDFGLACDVRVAAEPARFAESYVNLGMVPVAGGTFLLPLRVGTSAAIELIAGGELIDSARALKLGIVDEVVASEELDDRARAVATKLAAGPAATFGSIKRIVRGAVDGGFEASLQQAYEANVELIARPEIRDRIVRVMERYADR